MQQQIHTLLPQYSSPQFIAPKSLTSAEERNIRADQAREQAEETINGLKEKTRKSEVQLERVWAALQQSQARVRALEHEQSAHEAQVGAALNTISTLEHEGLQMQQGRSLAEEQARAAGEARQVED